VTSTPINIRNAKADFPEVTILFDYSKVLEDSSIELIVVATPNHIHKKYVARALKLTSMSSLKNH